MSKYPKNYINFEYCSVNNAEYAPEICNLSGNYCSFMGQQTNNDRAVIQGDSVHYIHNLSAFSGQPTEQ